MNKEYSYKTVFCRNGRHEFHLKNVVNKKAELDGGKLVSCIPIVENGNTVKIITVWELDS